MKSSKRLVFSTLFVGFLVMFPASFASADTGRYFIKSTKSFWKNALGVRHSFDNGFTTNLSDFQVRLNKIMGLQVEPVKMLQIFGEDIVDADAAIVDAKKPDATETPIPTASISPSSTSRKPNKTDGKFFPTDQTPWGIEFTYNSDKIASTSGGDGVRVAILDTGADVSHPDLKNRIDQCKDFTNFKYPIQDGKCDDKNGHGTHVSGIVAADGGVDGAGIYGVSPGAKLLIYKVCGNNGSCYADDVAIAIRTATDQKANIINMSFGSDSNVQMINDAINYAISKGVLPIAAAGNDGPFDDSINYPAALSSVIAVGALSQSFEVVEWSSRGTNSTSKQFIVEDGDIEFAAPGENIESTYNNGGYLVLSGTSMSSPFISGLAAKLWKFMDENPARATREYMQKIAIDILPVGDDNMSGFGIVQTP